MGITRRRLQKGFCSKNNLVWTVEDILQLGLNKKSGWPVESIKVVNAILKAIRVGLERDGFVTINGLGTFKVVTIKSYWNLSNDFTGKEREWEVVPARKVVRFKLSKAGRDFINSEVKSDGES